MLQNEALVAKIGFDPAENEPWKEWCVVAVQLCGDGGEAQLREGEGAGAGFGHRELVRPRRQQLGEPLAGIPSPQSNHRERF